MAPIEGSYTDRSRGKSEMRERNDIRDFRWWGKMEIWSLNNVVGVLSFLVLGGMWAVDVQAAGVGPERLSLEGPMVQGGLVQGKTVPGANVWVDGRNVRVSPQGMFLVGFGRDASPTVKLTMTYPDGKKDHHVLSIQERNYQVQRINGLPPRKVNPQNRDLARIQEDARLAKAARKLDAPRTDFEGGFIWPVIGKITGVYGSQRILNGEPRRPHFGVDIAEAIGTPVKAPASGVVTLAHPNMFFSGATLILDHGHGLSSTFLHLNKILVKKGDRITQGDVIAELGKSGRATGPHLDWRMNLFTQRIDPQLLVGPMPAK